MSRELLAIAVLAGIALVGVVVLAMAGVVVPDVLTLSLTALLGALTGASLPARIRRMDH
jgi:hypothetical protein